MNTGGTRQAHSPRSEGTCFVAGPPQVVTAVIPPESPDSRHSTGYAKGRPASKRLQLRLAAGSSHHTAKSNVVIPSESPRWTCPTQQPSVPAMPPVVHLDFGRACRVSSKFFRRAPSGNGGAP